MDNTLAKYFNKEDYATKVVKACRVVQGTARDSGNTYYALEIEFINGFTKRIFPNDAERFAVTNAFDMIDTQKTIDNNF